PEQRYSHFRRRGGYPELLSFRQAPLECPLAGGVGRYATSATGRSAPSTRTGSTERKVLAQRTPPPSVGARSAAKPRRSIAPTYRVGAESEDVGTRNARLHAPTRGGGAQMECGAIGGQDHLVISHVNWFNPP